MQGEQTPDRANLASFLPVTIVAAVQSLSRVHLFATPWTVACQALLSVGFFLQARILEWLPCPPSGDLSDPETEPTFIHWQVGSLPLSHLGSQGWSSEVRFLTGHLPNHIPRIIFHPPYSLNYKMQIIFFRFVYLYFYITHDQ